MREPASTWTIERLARAHARAEFRCGDEELDEYLRRFARQNDERSIARTFVAALPGTTVVLGYYSVRAGAVAFEALPEDERRRLPRYPVPVVHLARLAVDHRAQGRGLGETLLMDALQRALRVSNELGMLAVEVQAKNERARAFYERYGFVAFPGEPLHLYLSMKAVESAFR
jgi:ribosomal protein S18 acetylase RimI-like enzyme